MRLILLEGLKPNGDRPLVARRAQPKIDLIKQSFGGRRRKRADEPLRQARVILRGGQRALAAAALRERIGVIEQHEIEIGGRRHLAAAELAERDHRRAAALDPPVRSREFFLDPLQQAANQNFGEIGVGDARRRRRQLHRHKPHPDQEFLLLTEDAGTIERILVGARLGERGAKPLRQIVAAGRRRLDQRGDDARPPGDRLRELGRRAHDRRDETQQMRIGGEQGEELQPRRQAVHEFVESQKGLVRLSGRRERLEQSRGQLGQPFARPRRTHRRNAAEMPGAQALGHETRTFIAEPGKRRERLGIVLVAGEDEIAARRGKLGRAFEEPSVMTFDGLEPPAQSGREIVVAGKTHHAADRRDALIA